MVLRVPTAVVLRSARCLSFKQVIRNFSKKAGGFCDKATTGMPRRLSGLCLTLRIGTTMTALSRRQREAVFRAIADPTRREILNLLRRRRASVGEIAGNFRVSRPAISKHIRLLRRAGLVLSENQGTTRICRLNAAPLRAVDDWLREYQELWRESLHNLKRLVEEDR